MISDPNSFPPLLSEGIRFVFKIGFVLFALLYFIFSLIVIRQVFLMTETIKTEPAPILKLLAVIFSLVSLGVLIIFVLVL